MSIRDWLRAAAVAGAALGPQMAASPEAAASDVISRHAYWTAVSDTTKSGEAVCGVRTAMSNGAELRLMVLNNAIHMTAFDPNWTMPASGTSKVTISVDGDTYRGKAEVVSPRLLLVSNLSNDFLEQFIGGYNMVTDFGGVRWTVSLIGSSSATSAMADCIRAARGSYSS